MEESSTYQYVIEQGAERGRKAALQETLLDLATLRFGPPTPAITAALNSMEDPERLGRMRHRLLEAAGWDDLLATP